MKFDVVVQRYKIVPTVPAYSIVDIGNLNELNRTNVFLLHKCHSYVTIEYNTKISLFLMHLYGMFITKYIAAFNLIVPSVIGDILK